MENNYADPRSGSFLFTCRADKALNTIGKVLGDKMVRLYIEWDEIENNESRGKLIAPEIAEMISREED